MNHIRIKGWDSFQHFKDRCPPWIKVYRDLLDDPDWHELDGESAKVLVMLWLVASEDCNKEGRLPDSRKLSFRLRITDNELSQHLDKLKHWLIHDDTKTISTRHQDDDPKVVEGPADSENTEQLQVVKPQDSSDDINMISSRYQLDAPETEGEAEGEAETEVPENDSDTPPPESEEVKIANYLAEKILERDPKYSHLINGKRSKTVKAWAADLEKLHRIDKRDWSEIWMVVRWCRDDDFWSKNILSGSKVRAKFDQLLLQMPVPVDGNNQPVPDFMQGAI